MSTTDFHEATFRWPYPASDVIVTGSFDGWSRSIHLPRTASGFFQGSVKVPWGQKISYKYIVDGRWTTTDKQPTELDPLGNINNVYTAPTRPFQPKAEPSPTPKAPEPKPAPEEKKPQTVGQTNGILGTVKQTVTQIAEAIAPGTTDLSEDTPVQTPRAVPREIEQKQELEPFEQHVVEVVQPTPEPVSSPLPEVVSAPLPEPSVSSPAKEVQPEAVLPAPAKSADVLPVVPVTLVPLAHEEPPVNGASIQLESTTVDVAPTPTGKLSAEASTHTPVKPNGKAAVEPAEVAPLPITPAEAPVPSTPPATTTNGKTKPAEELQQPQPQPQQTPPSPPATPSASATTTPRKEKRSTFPTFGRRHRHSSSSHSVSEHGGDSQPSSPGKDSVSSIKGSTRKKRTSFFGKIRDVFQHDHHEKEGSK